ncbi:MAG TPA: hypothetical protein VGQ34_01455 [Sphingomicrobium sp.]|nr:hypothetical protein [Sphingomicrobium sp.]
MHGGGNFILRTGTTSSRSGARHESSYRFECGADAVVVTETGVTKPMDMKVGKAIATKLLSSPSTKRWFLLSFICADLDRRLRRKTTEMFADGRPARKIP